MTLGLRGNWGFFKNTSTETFRQPGRLATACAYSCHVSFVNEFHTRGLLGKKVQVALASFNVVFCCFVQVYHCSLSSSVRQLTGMRTTTKTCKTS